MAVLDANIGLVADAGGTGDAITATFNPPFTALTDKLLVWVVASATNGSSTPTFSPNGLPAQTIVKRGGFSLVAADITGAGFVMNLEYNLANTRWELLNPGGIISPLQGGTGLNTQGTTGIPVVTAGVWNFTDTFPSGTKAVTEAPGSNNTRIATTAYADAAVALAVTGLLDFKGSTDCSGNPNYPVALKGDAYVVSVAGRIGGAAGKQVDVGDVYVASADNAGGTEAAVGISWFVLEHNLQGALLAANNLSDVANAQTSRNNILPSKAGNTLKVLRVNAGETDYELAALSSGLTVTTKNADYPAVNGDLIVYDTNLANRTVTPPTATANHRFGVYLKTKTSTFKIIITGLDTLYAAGDYVEYVGDGTNWLKVIDAIAPITMKYTNTAGQATNNGATTTITNWTQTWDTANGFNATTGIYTIPKTGKYKLKALLTTNTTAWTTGNDRFIYAAFIDNTAATIAVGTLEDIWASSQQYIRTIVNDEVSLTAGQTVQLALVNSSGTNTTLLTAFNWIIIEEIK